MIKVLIIDDSAIVREILSTELSRDADIEVVGTAADAYIARDMIIERKPDVLTLDINMPRMDGITFLRKLMSLYPMPIIIVSSLTQQGSALAIEAINEGAVDVLCKPGSSYTTKEMASELIKKIKEAIHINVKQLLAAKKLASLVPSPTKRLTVNSSSQIMGIGASTGGILAIEYILSLLPANSPGTIMVQHIPEFFTKSLVERLKKASQMDVREAEDGDWVKSGTVLLAPAGKHILIRRSGVRYFVNLKKGPPVNFHCPSIDILFKSIAETAGIDSIGVILTGMGADGAKGLLEMKKAGALTIAQDEASSVAYGMPKAALELDAANQILPLKEIPASIVKVMETLMPDKLVKK